jgi:uncharacterized protein
MASPKNLSRRNFISGSALAIAPLAISSLGSSTVLASQAEKSKTKGSIITRKLGRTGLQVPIVSMGVMNADNPAVVQQSYERGVRLFDTAMGYQAGRNEEMIGTVMKNLGVRDKIFIQTKIHMPRLPETATAEEVSSRILNDFDGCLKRLQSDYVDILLLHGPNVRDMNHPGVKQAFGEAKKQRRAHFVGVSTHSTQAEILNSAVESRFYDTVTVGINFTQAGDSALIEAVKKAAAAGIGIIAMKTQATGRRGFAPGAPVNQTAALKWVLNHKEITTAIPGYTNFEHMNEDFSVAFGLDYTEEERKFLAEKNLSAEIQFCQQCSRCRPTCPRGVDIPTLMRTHMYAARYGNFLHARATLDEIDESAHLNLCGDCSSCKARCSGDVNIAANIRDLKSMYL